MPPIKEGFLNSDELTGIDTALKTLFGDVYVKTLIIHTYSKALLFQGTVFGSKDSQNHSSSMVYVGQHSKPAFVKKFLCVSVILQQDEHIHRLYLANVDWLLEHEYKNFFGYPAEVWCKYTPNYNTFCFIPVVSIQSRCAFVVHSIKFNRLLDEEVTVVIPLDHYCGLQ